MLQIFVNGVDVTTQLLQDNYSLNENMTDEPDVFTFSFNKYGAKTFLPTVNQEVLVYDNSVKVFGGNIIEINMDGRFSDMRVYTATCKDFSHIMDRYLAVEIFQNKPVVTIMNDLLNRYINKDYVLEISSFEPNEVWSAGTADTTNFRSGDQGLMVSSTNLVTTVANRSIITNLQPSGFASTDYTDIDIYVNDVSKLSSLVLRIGDGSTATNYYQYTITGLVTGWNRVRRTKASATSVGSPSWSSITGLQLRVTATSGQTVNVTFDNWNVSTVNAFTNNNSRNATQIVNYVAFNYLEPSKSIKKMADLFNWNWYVDPDRDIHFFGIFDEAAPFNIDDGALPMDGNYIYSSLRLSTKSDQLRNGVYVRGGDYLAAAINDLLTNQADGNNKIFRLAYRYADYTLTAGGVRKSVGIDNINSFTGNLGSNQLNSGTVNVNVGDVSGRLVQSQQVLVSKHGSRAAIKLRVRKVGNPVDNFTIKVYTNSSTNTVTAPSLSVTTSLAGGSITGSYVEQTFALTGSSPGSLIFDPDTSYQIAVSRSGAADAVNYYQVDASNLGRYDGTSNSSSTFTGPWSAEAQDFYFQEVLSYDVLYNFQEKVITFATAPAAATVIVWNGKPYKPVLVYTKDNTSISTYGEFQFRVYDPSIKSLTGAVQRANQELMAWADAIVEGEFSTYEPGLHAGMTITVSSAIRGLITDEYLIKRVSGVMRTSSKCLYRITLVSKKTLNLLYFLQRQLLDRSNETLIQDDEILEKLENLFDTVTLSDSITTAQNPVMVWSNDAGTTPNRLIWTGGSNYQWQS